MDMYFLKDNKYPFVLLFILLISNQLRAQQFTQFSSYLLSSVGINSAYVGSSDATEFIANYRKQWITLPGSPQTYFLGGSGYFENQKIGLGGILLRDKIGETSSTNLTLNGSYRIVLGKFKLQLGLNTGAQFYKQNLDNLEIIDEGDEVLEEGVGTQVLPVLGAGAYFFKEDFYLGISSPDFIESDLINKKRHFYVSLGKVFSINDRLKIKPALLTKYVQSSNVQFDLSSTIIFNDMLGVGASLRTGAGFVLFGELYPSDYLTLALAYDKLTNGLSKSEIGTIEATISYRLFPKKVTIYNPRYF